MKKFLMYLSVPFTNELTDFWANLFLFILCKKKGKVVPVVN
jgi:hypothetical protein